MPPGASERSLSALLWLGKLFACSVGDERLSEQIRRGVSFGGRLEVHLGNARFFSTDVRHVNFNWASSRL